MKVPNTLYILVLFQTVTFSQADTPCNAYVNDILKRLKEDTDYFEEPYVIPDDMKSFHLLDIQQGHVFGLSSVHLDGNVYAQKKNDVTQLKVYLGVGEMSLRCKSKIKGLFGLGPVADVEANVPYINIELNIVPEADGSNPKIVNFKFEEVKGLAVHISGLGPIRNIIWSIFIKIIGQFFHKLIKFGLEERFKKYLESKITEFTVPEECLQDVWQSK